MEELDLVKLRGPRDQPARVDFESSSRSGPTTNMPHWFPVRLAETVVQPVQLVGGDAQDRSL
jgi:hypothetical protein